MEKSAYVAGGELSEGAESRMGFREQGGHAGGSLLRVKRVHSVSWE